MMDILFVALAIYLAFGLIAALVLKRTPYAEVPLWRMVLLWPLFFFR